MTSVPRLLPVLILCAACGGSDQVIEITDTRSVARPDLRLGLSSSQRFRDEPVQRARWFVWETPDTWEERPPTEYRDGSFALPDGVDCSLSRAGGGLRDNLNRWRGQMGLGGLTDAEVEALPVEDLAGADAKYVEFTGDYQGMGDESQPGFKMIGYVARFLPNQSVFVKVVGPEAAVDAQKPSIERFVASVSLSEQAREYFQALAAQLAGEGANDPSGTDNGGGGTPAPGRFEWTVPSEWERTADKTMRLVNLRPRGKPGTECWISELGGEGGGLLMNVRRWYDQVGAEPPGSAVIEALPEIRVLGRDSKIVEIEGESHMLIGVACFLGDSALFVKILGPIEEVRGERERFVAFCQSLRM